MTSPNSTIQRLILELKLDDMQEHAALQQGEAFKHLFVESMLPRLEDFLKKYENNSTTIRINKLDISLDDLPLNADSLDQPGTLIALYEMFEKKIADALSELPLPPPGIIETGTDYISNTANSPGKANGNFSVLSTIEQQADTLIFYLAHGYLPWNSHIADFPDPVDLLKEVLARVPAYFRQQLIVLSDSQQAVKRLVLQFPEALLKQVVTLISPELSSELEPLAAVVKPEFLRAASRTVPSILSEAAIKHALKTVNHPQNRETIRESILKEAAFIANTDFSFLQKALEPAFPGEVKDAGKMKEVKELTDSAPAENRSVPVERPAIGEDPGQLETDGVYVTNAGLILAWPYLQLFFKELEVYTEKGLEHKEKAMHLLHYLCFGSEQDWEYALFLNKIVCGWEPEEPTGQKIVLSEKEKAECDQLIEAIVRNWPALKNTSVDGFREAFLQRNGIISRVNDNWLLRIERKGYDMMLEQLEWGINTIQLSWNDYRIFVEW